MPKAGPLLPPPCRRAVKGRPLLPPRLCQSSSKGKLHQPDKLASLNLHKESRSHLRLTPQVRPRQAMTPSHLWAFWLQLRFKPACHLWFQGNFTTVKQPPDRRRQILSTKTASASAPQAMNPSLQANHLGKCHMHRRHCCPMLPQEAGHELLPLTEKIRKVRQLSILCSKSTSSSCSTTSKQLAAERPRSKHLSFCRNKLEQKPLGKKIHTYIHTYIRTYIHTYVHNKCLLCARDA